MHAEQNRTCMHACMQVLPPRTDLACCACRREFVFSGSATENNGTNLILVNGGFQPRISMPAHTWHRWRVLYSASKGWMVLQVLERSSDGSLSLSNLCELQMTAKDGAKRPTATACVPPTACAGLCTHLLCCAPHAPAAAPTSPAAHAATGVYMQRIPRKVPALLFAAGEHEAQVVVHVHACAREPFHA